MATGTSGNDSMAGGSGNDTISGVAGNDTLSGFDGNDELYGGTGADSVYGGNGNDAASGGSGNDLLDGGTGGDNLVGGQGVDTFYGGTGNDTIIGDCQWMSTASMASSGEGNPTNLTVVNNADGPIKLFWVDSSGNTQFVATIASGQTYALSTRTNNNYVLLDEQNYFLDAIYGTSNQTFTYAAPFGDLAYGGGDDDLIVSQYGDDTVYGDDGNDTVYGGYGKDSIFGGLGNDSLLGEAGDDSVFGGAGNDTVSLGDGNDSFGSWSTDESGDDRIDGGLGNDSLNGGFGNDTVYGGEGDDTLTGAQGNDTLYGGAGTDSFAITDDHQGDTIFGGESAGDNDIITFANSTSTQGVNVTFSGTEAGSYSYQGGASGSFSEIEAVAATNNNDTLNAAAATGNVQLFGMAGDDSITGGAGNDTIYFGAGNDTVFGGAGRDLIDDTAQRLEFGTNLIDAGGGNDTVMAGGGNDTVFGGAGDDLLMGEAGSDNLSGGVGADSLYGDDGSDTLDGGAGNDILSGGDGGDTFLIGGSDGTDTITGGETGSDWDTLIFANPATQGVNVTFTGTEAGSYSYNGGAATGSFSQIEVVTGSNLADTIDASAAGSGVNVNGGGGGDSIIGSGSNDFVSGDDGNDSIWGGAGDDTLNGNLGDDQLFGGSGNDLILTNTGNDAAFGGDGNDYLSDQTGSATLSGDAGADSLYGGDDADWLYGGAENDLLFGGTGNDVLQGGAGNDRLTGGTGNDRFDLRSAGGADVISDFDTALAGGVTADQLDVSDLRNPDGSAVRAWDVRVTDDGNGHAVLTFPGGESVVLTGVSPVFAAQRGTLHAMGVPCFAAGTRILTPEGERAVEHLVAGDLVLTSSGPAEPLLWCGQRTVVNLAVHSHLRPVRLATGAFGARRSLTLSPQHAVCVTGPAGPALVRARHLTEFDTQARVVHGLRKVDYHHFLLPRHALVFAEGALVESFYPGAVALAALLPQDQLKIRNAILAQLPQDSQESGKSLAQLYGPRCLPLLSRREAKAFMAARLPDVPSDIQHAAGAGESVSAITTG